MVDETLSLTELRTRIETLSKGPMLRGWVYCEAAPLAEFINQYADDRAAALEAELTQARAERDAARRALDAAKKEAADWKEEAIAMRARS